MDWVEGQYVPTNYEEKEIMSVTSSSSKWYQPYYNWTACPIKYNYVGIVYDKDYGRYEATIYRSVSGNSAQSNLNRYRSSRYKSWLLTREQYTNLLQMIKNDNIPENYNVGELVSTGLAVLEQKTVVIGKIVHLVWNVTTGTVAWASLTQEDAVKKGQELARLAPTHEFTVCSPVKKIYQPSNVTVDDYKAD